MGKFFPDYRTGTTEQVRAFRRACYDLFRNGRYEQAARIRHETARYLDLNGRVCAAEAPLTRTQSRWHWQRALGAEDRDFRRMQRAADRQAPRRQRRAISRQARTRERGLRRQARRLRPAGRSR
jgi:hypothetical protein